MFLPLLLPTLLAIGLSILAWRLILGYLVKPMGPMRPVGRMGIMRRLGRFVAWVLSEIERRGKSR
jgi:hypothetical protein